MRSNFTKTKGVLLCSGTSPTNYKLTRTLPQDVGNKLPTRAA